MIALFQAIVARCNAATYVDENGVTQPNLFNPAVGGRIVLGTGSVRLEISDPNNSANNVLADFNLATGAYSNVQANGQAVGPQYQATGFITAAGVIQEPNGFWRIWVAGHTPTAVPATATHFR
jgi:hypothetical protein